MLSMHHEFWLDNRVLSSAFQRKETCKNKWNIFFFQSSRTNFRLFAVRSYHTYNKIVYYSRIKRKLCRCYTLKSTCCSTKDTAIVSMDQGHSVNDLLIVCRPINMLLLAKSFPHLKYYRNEVNEVLCSTLYWKVRSPSFILPRIFISTQLMLLLFYADLWN